MLLFRFFLVLLFEHKRAYERKCRFSFFFSKKKTYQFAFCPLSRPLFLLIRYRIALDYFTLCSYRLNYFLCVFAMVANSQCSGCCQCHQFFCHYCLFSHLFCFSFSSFFFVWFDYAAKCMREFHKSRNATSLQTHISHRIVNMCCVPFIFNCAHICQPFNYI